MKKLFLLIYFVITISAYAESIKISATLDRDQIYEGDRATLIITISGIGDRSVRPAIPQVDGAVITLPNPPSISTTIINGVMSRELIYSYIITPKIKGEISIPPFEIVIENTKYKTKPLKINVLDIQKTDKLFIESKLNVEDTYIQSRVSIKYDFFFAPGVIPIDLKIPVLSRYEIDGFYNFSMVKQNDIVKIGDNRFYCLKSFDTRNGVRYNVYSIAFTFFPEKEGTFTLAAPTIIGGIQKGTRVVRDFFGYTEQPNYEEIRAKGENLILKVKTLPEEGKPEGFNGAIGNYSIAVSANTTKLKVGDPIELKITITGDGLLEKLPRPDITAQEDFIKNFKITESLQPGEIRGDSIIFSQIIRPLNAETQEIPPVRFPYFNSGKGAYEIAKSNPIPIEVKKTTDVTTENVIKTEGSEDYSIIDKTKVESRTGGINSIYFKEDALIDQRFNSEYLLILILPVAGYITSAVIIKRKRKFFYDKTYARSKFARKSFNIRISEARKLSGKDFYDTLWKGIGRFVSDKLALGEGELTAYDIEQLKKNSQLKNETINDLCEILKQCDAGRFSVEQKQDNNRHELIQKCEDIAKRIERELKK